VALLRSVLFALICYPISALISITAMVSACFGQETAVFMSRRWALWHRWCAKHLLGISWQIKGRLDGTQALYVFKHESMFEAIETLALFERPIVVMKQELLDLPVWGFASKVHGSIGVNRDAGASAMRAMIAAAKKAKATGRPIILFPEGTRVPHGDRPALKAGMAGLYKILNLPVIPVALDAGRVWTKGFVKKPGRIRMKVSDPIPAGLPREQIEARVHQAINLLND
jgi:1-acyl-sn-glycerol-3-phosphate acyltransferase